jgi:hypothetical protein
VGDKRVVWSVVDPDASNDYGQARLQTQISATVMLRLSNHLSELLIP